MELPLVLLHGFTGRAESFAPVLEHLRPGRTAVALNLPGHHPDAPEAADFEAAVDALAEQIAGTLDRPAHLVGYSMGSRVALGLLLRHPKRFARATLIGVHPGLPEGPERWARAQWEGRWIALLRHEGLEAFLAAWEALPLFDTQRAAAPEVLAAQSAIRRGHDPAGLARALAVLGLSAQPDYRPALAGIRVPVRLVAGGEDEKFRRLAGPLAAAIPGAEAVTLPGLGHNPLVEAPARLAALLADDAGAPGARVEAPRP